MATTTLLTLKSTFYDAQGELYTGTATGGSTSSLTDSGLIGYVSETWPTKLENTQLRVTSGAASGDLRMVGRADRSEGTLYPNALFSGGVANAVTYELWGSAINGGSPLTTLFNTVLRSLRPVTDTQVTVVTNQNQYDLTTFVQNRRAIRGVYLRLLDSTGAAPYRIVELRQGLDWDAYDRGGAGTTSVTLNLFSSRTLNAAAETLWVRADTTFAALTSDTSTVDAVYRDWLAWEAVLELAKRKLNGPTSDRPRWTALRDRAADEVSGWRSVFIPREPTQISTWP